MRSFLTLSALILINLQPSFASASPLYSFGPPNALSQKGRHPIKIEMSNEQLNSAKTISVVMPLTREVFELDVTEISRYDDITSLIAANDDISVSLSASASGTFGSIVTRSEKFHIETTDGDTALVIPPKRKTAFNRRLKNDYRIPPKSALNTSKRSTNDIETQGLNAQGDGPKLKSNSVDLMLVYSSSVRDLFGANTQLRLQEMVNDLNRMTANSGVGGRFRLVHTEETSYPNNTDTLTTLVAIETGEGVFSNIASTRNRVGADIVISLRRYVGGNCGQANLLGVQSGQISQFERERAYGVVGIGSAICDDATLAHEIGHIMGLIHGQNDVVDGVFPFSRGFSDAGRFDTIMSVEFTGPQQFSFSNPNNTCLGRPCGVPNSFDAARSLNAVFSSVAAFTRSTSSPPPSAPEPEPEPKKPTLAPIHMLLLDEQG